MTKFEKRDLWLLVKDQRKRFRDVGPQSSTKIRGEKAHVYATLYQVLSKVAHKSDAQIRDYLEAIDTEIVSDGLRAD